MSSSYKGKDSIFLGEIMINSFKHTFVIVFCLLSISVHAATFAARDEVSEKFTKMREIIEEYRPKCCEDVRGKDITVLLGNTGAGKSTMINLLARAPMEVDWDGNFRPVEGQQRVKVGAGGVAVTKFPEIVPGTELGHLCDLPGFQDTGSARSDTGTIILDSGTSDILNAAFIRLALTNARSVRAVFLTTEDELKAERAKPFRALSSFVNLFKSQEFRDGACYLLVNRVERSLISRGRTASLFEGANEALEPKDRHLKRLIDTGKVFFIPKARAPGDTEEALSEKDKILKVYEDVIEVIGRVPHMPVPESEIDMSLSMNSETTGDIRILVDGLLNSRHANMINDDYAKLRVIYHERAKADRTSPPGSQLMKDNLSDFWNGFIESFRKSDEWALLYPICGSHIDQRLSEFESFFQKAHNAQVQELVIIEQKEATEEAEKAKRKAQEEAAESERQAQEAKEAEKVARENENKAKRIAKEKEKEAQEKMEEAEQAKIAEKIAREKAEEEAERAEKAQKDASLSEEQKREALRRAEVADRELRQKTEEAERISRERVEAEARAREAMDAERRAKQEVDRTREEMLERERLANKKLEDFREMAAEATKKNEEMQRAYEKRMTDIQEQARMREEEAARNIETMRTEINRIQAENTAEKREAEKRLADYQDRQQRAMEELTARQERERQAWEEKLEAQQRKMQEDREELEREMSRVREQAEKPAQQQVVYVPWWYWYQGNC